MAEHQPGHVREAAKEAAAVQAIQLLAACGMIIIGVVLQVAQRHAADPDFAGTWHARWAKGCERGWATAAGVCYRRAERFRVEYERAVDHGY